MWNIVANYLRIEKFRKLRRLFLWGCVNVDNIFGNESLEELIIDLGNNENSFYWNALMCLPKLRTLVLTCDNHCQQYLEIIIKERSNDIIELGFHSCIEQCDPTILQYLKRLIRLTFIIESLTVEKLQTLVAGLSLLEQLDLVDFQLFST